MKGIDTATELEVLDRDECLRLLAHEGASARSPSRRLKSLSTATCKATAVAIQKHQPPSSPSPSWA
jgi:hypothetical protein